jgi:hypothetical protein
LDVHGGCRKGGAKEAAEKTESPVIFNATLLPLVSTTPEFLFNTTPEFLFNTTPEFLFNTTPALGAPPLLI